MHITDPVADMLTRIRNANVVYHEMVDMPLSKLRLEMARILKEEGYISTQTTLSRDLKALRISKVRARSGLNVYALPREGQFDIVPTLEEINQAKWRLNFSGNLMVVHTPPGHASMVAYDVDNVKHPSFLGTIAGDDTVLVVLTEDADKEEAANIVRDLFPKLS